MEQKLGLSGWWDAAGQTLMPGPASIVPPRWFACQHPLLLPGSRTHAAGCLEGGLGCASSTWPLPCGAMSLRPAARSRNPPSMVWCSGAKPSQRACGRTPPRMQLCLSRAAVGAPRRGHLSAYTCARLCAHIWVRISMDSLAPYAPTRIKCTSPSLCATLGSLHSCPPAWASPAV